MKMWMKFNVMPMTLYSWRYADTSKTGEEKKVDLTLRVMIIEARERWDSNRIPTNNTADTVSYSELCHLLNEICEVSCSHTFYTDNNVKIRTYYTNK